MMGLGLMGSGGGVNYSSDSIPASNLSASAPPFTVDRLNPNSSSNPNLHYPKSPYSVEPYSHTWQYAAAPPSAPGPDLVINSTGISSLPLYDDYQFSASASIRPSSTHQYDPSPSMKALDYQYGYGGEVDPYHSPYVPSVVGEDSSVVEDNGPHYSVLATSGMSVSSQIDYNSSLFDLGYGRQWVDSLGFDDGKRSKGVEVGGSLFPEKAYVGDSVNFTNQLNQGACGGEYWNKSKNEYGVPYQKLNQVSDQKVHAGSLSVRPIEDQSSLEQNIGFLSHESNKTHIPASNSTYPESNPLLQSFEMQDNFSNYRNAFSPYEKCARHVDSPFTGPASGIRSSPTVVIRPPPATNGNPRQVIASCTLARKEDSFEANLFSSSKKSSDQNSISSTSVKELSTLVHAKDAYDCKVKARFGSQLPVTNASGDFYMACDGVQFVNSNEGSSDFTDHNNTAVDSPCWKGASSSQFSSFDVEAGNSDHVMKKQNDCCEEHQKPQPNIEFTKLSSEKGVKARNYDEKDCTKDGALLTLERTLGDIFPSREIIDGPNMPGQESGLLNDWKSGFDMQNLGPMRFVGEVGSTMTLNDVPEGSAVAVHVAENVLDSSSSQEDANEPTRLIGPMLSAPTMIKAIHNLSELLLFHLSNDACSLEEENTETLKRIISNLDSCMTKKVVQVTNKLEPSNPVGNTSGKHGEYNNVVGTTAGSRHTIHESTRSILPDYQHMHGQKLNYDFSGEKDEKSAVFSPLRDDVDSTRDDVMAEAIKKVLEENFHFGEEMHSQAFLFKSLWLEAEAKLCSISYKARFDRMKNQMDKNKFKGPKENEGIAEMMSKVCISPDPIAPCQLSPKAHNGTIPKPTVQNLSISNTCEPGSDIDASVISRFNILRSREENLKPVIDEKEEQSEKVDGELGGSVMTRFNILKSREEMSNLIDTKEEKQPGMVDSEHAGPVMARFNILKSREEKSKSLNIKEEKQPEVVNSQDDNSKSVHMDDGQRTKMVDVESEDEIMNVTLKPHFMHQNEGKIGSYADGSGYDSLKEVQPWMTNDPMVSSSSSRIINKDYSGWLDSSYSQWEHVLKDDFSWKKL